ncbi:MAG: ribose 5-phosphate isomerase [Tepidanaerobacteraceae bacterium]|nr:ribose 5-phosphate isomerase [Tepidanaerobacteraceae bacterium]
MKLAIGCDEAGFDLKQVIMEFLKEKGIDFDDMGCYSKDPVLYPDVAEKVALAVAEGNYDRGILICGTGIGMAITANKIPGVRAACCHDVYSAERARKSNDAQIMTMGSRVIGPELAKSLVAVWLESNFSGGRSIPKVERMNEIDAKYRATKKVG